MAIFSTVTIVSKLFSLGKFLRKNWQMVIIVLMVLAVLWYHNDRTNQIEDLTEQVSDLKTELASCNGALSNQNQIIDVVANTGRKLLEEERQRAAEQVKLSKKQTDDAISRIKNKKVSQNCRQAIEDMVKEAQGELQW